MNYYTLIPLSSFIINIFLVGYILSKGMHTREGRAYILFTGCVALWELSEFFIWSPLPDVTILLLLRTTAIFFIPTGFLFLNFMFSLTKKKRNIIYYLLLGTVVSSIVLTMTTGAYYADTVVRYFYGNGADIGPLYRPIRLAGILVPTLYSVYILFTALKTTNNPVFRKQLKILSAGLLLSLMIGIITNLILSDFLEIYLFQHAGSSVIVVMSIFIFIAIVKYRFLSDSMETIVYDLLSRIKESFIVFDHDHRLVAINSPALSLLSINKGIGRKLRAEDIFPAGYSFDEDCTDLTITMPVKGEPHYILLTQTSLVQSGIPAGKLVILNDITEHKKTENMIKDHYIILEIMNEELSRAHEEVVEMNRVLALEKERLGTMLRSIGEGVITVDYQRHVEIVNSIAEKITGCTGENALGRPVEDILPIYNVLTNQTGRDMIDEVLRNGTIVEMRANTVMNIEGGNKKNISAIGAPIRACDGDVDGAILVFRDVTDRVRMENELIKTSKIESLSVFAGGIAHDFNNLLTSILGNTSLAKLAMNENITTEAFINEIEKASRRAKDLTLQLLAFSKGGAPIKQTTSIQDLLRDTVDFSLSGSPVKCEFHISANLHNAEVDEGQISQVIQNLILNAHQAMPDGGTIGIKAQNCTVGDNGEIPLAPGDYIKISVIDQGTGIDDRLIPYIFDPFFTTKDKGSGLGLAVTYSIIKKHGGYINVKSTLGRGSTFNVFLPATSATLPRRNRQCAEKPFRGGRILLMDDDLLVLKVCGNMLAAMGFQFETAENGEDAIRQYHLAKKSERPFDVVIMDLTIPGGMGGKEAIGILKDSDPGIVAIVSSGYSNDPVMAHYRDHGFRDMIAKPYTYDDLVEVLRRVMYRDGVL